MKNIAPNIDPTRLRKELDVFDWRIGTDTDAADLQGVLAGNGSWEEVQIPHYGPPLGRAVTYYRTAFDVTQDMLDKGRVFICFKGVDYQAHIFVNGVFLCSHEGFFAPFEFETTQAVKLGENSLLVKVENDAICMGNDTWSGTCASNGETEGDKLYAATGPGYDDPETGWHHCPPGMGIYQGVFVEARAALHVHDVFVRPIISEGQTSAQATVEVFNCDTYRKDLSLKISVLGQNFEETVFKDLPFEVAYAGPTVNYYTLDLEMPDARLWTGESPWLYQIQVTVLDADGKVLDTVSSAFGMRTFRMDEEAKPKGRFYLNDQEIRLRGANTMGHLQQCVMKKDWDQLRDDILLAKICHMNFFRLTQRPVQPEIYELCNQLGMMTQTDLPLFGVFRRNKFCEAIRQAEEMERLVRNYTCNIMVSYINEPFPKSWPEWDRPHRNLSRAELESFFVAADQVVRLANPDRVIKAVDGDYDPPAAGLPDNHCYCGWYGGHGVEIGKLNKGYWQKIKPGWMFGCGEFGAEGMESVELMRKHYPAAWLPQSVEEEATWSPNSIVKAQTGGFHHLWFETQNSLDDWVEASQSHQAWATRMMTQAYRRDDRMNTFAIHLFIDAFPSGWMKTIMDFERQAKKAFFVYRDVLTPLMTHWRTDRYSYFSGEPLELEAWICNDLNTAPDGLWMHYQLEMDGQIVFSQKIKTEELSGSRCVGSLNRLAPKVDGRNTLTARIGLLTADGKVLNDSSIEVEVFERTSSETRTAVVLGEKTGAAHRLAEELGLNVSSDPKIADDGLILINDMDQFEQQRDAVEQAVERGATAVFLELPEGDYSIASHAVSVEICDAGPRQFVSRATGHPMVAGFKPKDFRFWYDPAVDHASPFLETVFNAPAFEPILSSGQPSKGVGLSRAWEPIPVAAQVQYGDGFIRVCQVALAGRVQKTPVADRFARRLLGC